MASDDKVTVDAVTVKTSNFKAKNVKMKCKKCHKNFEILYGKNVKMSIFSSLRVD